MIVVADTAPLRYLAELRLTDLLPRLYSEIAIPIEVHTELLAPKAPASVRQWILDKPNWVSIRIANLTPPQQLAHLDAGEIAAIMLAVELKAPAILVDDLAARHSAQSLFGISVTGTLGILRNAHGSGLIDGHTAFERLISETNFRHSSDLDRMYLASLTK